MSSHSRKTAWIVDCGTTCHMCNDQSVFVAYESLKTPLKVTLGDVTKYMHSDVEL